MYNVRKGHFILVLAVACGRRCKAIDDKLTQVRAQFRPEPELKTWRKIEYIIVALHGIVIRAYRSTEYRKVTTHHARKGNFILVLAVVYDRRCNAIDAKLTQVECNSVRNHKLNEHGDENGDHQHNRANLLLEERRLSVLFELPRKIYNDIHIHTRSK